MPGWFNRGEIIVKPFPVCGIADGHLIFCYLSFGPGESPEEDDYFAALFTVETVEGAA